MKKLMRTEIMRYLKNLSREQRHRIEEEQFVNVTGTSQWERARVIAITVSKYPEWSTRNFIEKGWEEGKKVAVPKVSPTLKSMEFYLVHTYEQMKEGYSGILEPDPEFCSIIHKKDIDLLFVPGLLFNYDGYRIGFGGGFYDRYLETFSGKTLSVTSENQLQDFIPVEDHDIPVQLIVTESRLINTSGEE
ncbi:MULTISPECIES: 5-formyltetrahydrofolate cyclo-ligase [Salimicrobium]|uniref:5-formyltetrahydrofolate cyclo-ligase n=4 Tax=Salimicrobium TaxID=351195 RepID=K2FMY6_9BACI|nr:MULTISPECIES: 5-formyltetrahydrofolate cyclo-ligase [Salimicrobium]AKG04303.1 5-formyltetrahydrofolate cyclo-ligase [Salimicrobium jeotgali]EKE32276.1 5-formyltetrahydrofolate cyclo-ligase [Salimicrobium jeotgali]MBM7695888.1 5-formyltetrahydrofolate cyclo-ligase [Salimicrobium jeotgali]PBB04694.1 5-formyltetrahydrofolate cyclo-ligase [Salimicrobium humidisoli]SDX68891.1 5-formyltetrahydrofolate cyclo-ligase [Salimicrobium album]